MKWSLTKHLACVSPCLWQVQQSSLDSRLRLVHQKRKQVQDSCRLAGARHLITTALRLAEFSRDCGQWLKSGNAGIHAFQQSVQQCSVSSHNDTLVYIIIPSLKTKLGRSV